MVWIFVLPHYKKYRIRQELVILDDESAKVHRLVKVHLSELERWDAEHDVLGNRIQQATGSDSLSNADENTESAFEKKEV